MDNNLSETIVSAILDADRTRANELIDQWAEEHSYARAMIEVVTPVLDVLGQMYDETGEFSLAQAYVGSKVAEDVFAKVLVNSDPTKNVRPTKGPVVIGNIEDDYHPLGRKMVGIFLRAADWQVVDLGIDVTPKEFVDKALEVDARIIGASAMIFTTAVNIKKLRKEIDDRGLKGRLKLAVGGAVFKLRPELIEDVGADGSTENALLTPALFDELWDASVAERPVS
jgi:methylmalonyl-CoA mutase cobalamin-binding domain/chain